MKLDFTLTAEDLMEVNQANRRSNPSVKRWTFWLIVLLVTIFAYHLFRGPDPSRPRVQPRYEEPVNRTQDEDPLLYILTQWTPILLIAGVFLVFRKWDAKRVWKQSHFLHYPTEYVLDERGLATKTQIGEGFMEWVAFQRFMETKSLFLLYLSDFQVHLVPKRSMSPEQMEELRQLLVEKIGLTR